MASVKRIILILVVVHLATNTYSQPNHLHIEKSESKYFADTLYSQIEFSYTNTSDSTFVLWIEKDNVDKMSNQDRIRKHFYKQYNDCSLMQIIWDGSVASFVPDLFEMFIKVIRPKEHFIVSMFKKGDVEKGSELVKTLENRIVVVGACEIKGFPIDSRIDMFNFFSKSITIPTEWLNDIKAIGLKN